MQDYDQVYNTLLIMSINLYRLSSWTRIYVHEHSYILLIYNLVNARAGVGHELFHLEELTPDELIIKDFLVIVLKLLLLRAW